MPLLGPQEKGELQGLVLARLDEYWSANGAGALLAPGTCVALPAKGPVIAASAPPGTLASVEIRTLFTALCHLNSEEPGTLPRESLAELAAEAAAALATQVNRLLPD